MYMNPPIIKLSEHLCSVVHLWLVTQLRESHTCKLYTANAKKTRKREKYLDLEPDLRR